jgi:hypothetical protein
VLNKHFAVLEAFALNRPDVVEEPNGLGTCCWAHSVPLLAGVIMLLLLVWRPW